MRGGHISAMNDFEIIVTDSGGCLRDEHNVTKLKSCKSKISVLGLKAMTGELADLAVCRKPRGGWPGARFHGRRPVQRLCNRGFALGGRKRHLEWLRQRPAQPGRVDNSRRSSTDAEKFHGKHLKQSGTVFENRPALPAIMSGAPPSAKSP